MSGSRVTTEVVVDSGNGSSSSIQEATIPNYDFNTVTKWSSTDVASWLRSKAHDEDYITLLCENQRIDGKSLLVLTETDLKQPPIQIKVLGDMKRLYFDILELQHICSSNNLGLNTICGIGNVPFLYFPPSSSNTSHIESEIDCTTALTSQATQAAQNSYHNTTSHLFANYGHHAHAATSQHQIKKLRKKKRRVSIVDSADSQVSDLDEDPQSSCGEPKKLRSGNGCGNSRHHHHSEQSTNNKNGNNTNGRKPVLVGYASDLEPEVGKALIAMGYVFIVTWVTALCMVIVHDRVPNMEKYPPLPDLFLDNMPHIPWAFEMCEVTGTVLMCIWIGVLFFHKHRFILIRRFFALSGTVFLLRCVTMLITSLSVPGTHLTCNPRVTPYGDWRNRLYNAFLIWKGAGLSIQGVRTCGDYMFSGHTVALTMLNFFITEYTTRRLYFIHTISWLLNSFGIFFILSAHEHYSIDVFIAFYITSRLFLYYHTLANNQALMHRDSKRTKVWFPLFSYFESSVNGIVPNQYEFPITVERLKNWGLLILKTMESKWKEVIPHPNEGFLRTKEFFKPKVKNSE